MNPTRKPSETRNPGAGSGTPDSGSRKNGSGMPGNETYKPGCENPDSGSMTLEAAVALPVFFCVAIALAFLLRAVQVHEQVQHAISQAALEIAGVSYIYDVSGALDIQREGERLVERGADRVEDSIINSMQFEDWLPKEASDEVISQLNGIAPALNDKINGVLFSKYVGRVARKYLNAFADAIAGGPQSEYSGKTAADGKYDALGGLNIVGGGDGLNFTESTYLTNDTEDVKIRVRYAFRIPIPIEPLAVLGISQQACAKAWLAGAASSSAADEPDEIEDDIWSLDNFTRGRRIQAIFHANLPINFPGLSSYENGTATLIRSLDTTAASYRDSEVVGRQIESYVKSIRDYKGQEKPYGSERIVIPPEDIRTRRLVLVIPRNDLAPEVSAEIDRQINEAMAQGVILQVERYAKKLVEDEENGD